MIDTMTRRELETEIVADKSLYAQFDEAKLLNEEYTDAELRAIVQKWIEQCDETAACTR